LDDPQAVTELLNAQKEITELYSELSYDELKGVLENWLNPSAPSNGSGNPINEELASAKVQPKQSTVSTDMGGSQDIGGLPWDDETPTASTQKASPLKEDVASAFDDLFNN
jgi:hypothetical protein